MPGVKRGPPGPNQPAMVREASRFVPLLSWVSHNSAFSSLLIPRREDNRAGWKGILRDGRHSLAGSGYLYMLAALMLFAIIGSLEWLEADLMGRGR